MVTEFTIIQVGFYDFIRRVTTNI